ncbi:hypothetical protein CTAYLR_010308 [Chrysophaeum taylorii]|uniref:Protein kinase domain-containing protein n=1 Tax=Chrysophaeum taylorii TaxID=2483200 RepID=A0AAD7XMB5_9STRA|nr:hypothetical protein CTAYLR_010308 [Chrysophaeum taylorii]
MKRRDRQRAVVTNAGLEAGLEIVASLPQWGICGVAKEILLDVRRLRSRAKDVAQAGRRVVDVLDFLLLARGRVDEEDTLLELEQLLEDLKYAVREYGKSGFLKRMWRQRRHAGSKISLVDEKIRDKLEFLTQAYGVVRDSHVELLLRTHVYKLEEALGRFSGEEFDSDAKALEEVAREGGVDAEESRVALAALAGDEKNYAVFKATAEQLMRAIERNDEVAVVAAAEKAEKTEHRTLTEPALAIRLVAASFLGDTRVVEAVLQEAPDIVHETLGPWAAPHVAAFRGNLDTLELLGHFEVRDARDRTPLHHAAARGQVEVVRFLVEKVVDLEAKDCDDRTALMVAAYAGRVDVVECLRAAVDVDAGFSRGDETAVDLAFCRGHVEVVQALEGAKRLAKPIAPRAPPRREVDFFSSSSSKEEEEEEKRRVVPRGRFFRFFEVEELMARSEFGDIYIAKSSSSSSSSYGARSAMRRRSLSKDACREAMVAAELGSHPCVVSLEYCAVVQGEFFEFFTLVDGGRDLERLASSGDLYDGDLKGVRDSILSLLQQVASGLAFCHSRGVLHQDLRLENVLVGGGNNNNNRARLTGFGSARKGDGVGAQLRAPLVGGGSGYASPEVLAATKRHDEPMVSPAETDIWAFGVLALRLYYADDDTFPLEARVALEEIVNLQPPDDAWSRVDVDVWLQRHLHTIHSYKLDGASLFHLNPNNLRDASRWIKKKRDRAKLRRLLLAPDADANLLLRACLAVRNQRPACGADLFKWIRPPASLVVSSKLSPPRFGGETLLNLGRAFFFYFGDIPAARAALESAVAEPGADLAECFALLACAHLDDDDDDDDDQNWEEAAAVASDKAIQHDPSHAGALLAKAEAARRGDPDSSNNNNNNNNNNNGDDLFAEVIRRSKQQQQQQQPASPSSNDTTSSSYLEAARREADDARDPITNQNVSVSACVRDLPPRVFHRTEVKVAGSSGGGHSHHSAIIKEALGAVLPKECVEPAMRTGRVVLEGEAGSGKGWTLRALVVALCDAQQQQQQQQQQQSEPALLPLLVSLSSIEDPAGDWGMIRDNRRVVLCLDGLDEISPSRRRSVVDAIVERAENCAFVVVASRPSVENIDDLGPRGFVFLSIARVDRERVVEGFGIELDAAAHVETPLALRLALLGAGREIRDRSDLFRVADEVFMGRAVERAAEDDVLTVARDVLRDCGVLEVRRAFEWLALAAHENQRILLQRSDFEGLKTNRLAAAIWVLARAGRLPPLVPRGTDSVAFFHLTFQELYVASILGPDNLLADDEAFDLGDPWWQAPALFAFQLAKEDARMRDRALDVLAERIPKLRVGEQAEICLGKYMTYFPCTIVEIDSANNKIGVQRVRRDVAGVAAFARRAAADGETSLAAGLVNRGADLITPVDPATKDSALHAAARAGRAECAQLLLAAGAWSRGLNKSGSTPRDLSVSCVIDVHLRAEMVRVFHPPKCDEDLAAHPFVPGVIEWLDSNDDLDEIPDDEDWDDDVRSYAFAQACHRRRYRAATTLAFSVDVNGSLSAAAAAAKDHKSPPSSPESNSSRPLHFAVVNSCTDALNILLERGARVDDAAGKTALALAARLNRSEALALLLEKVKHGEDFLGDALHSAAQYGFLDCARLLIDKGAEIEQAAIDSGSTPLHVASWNGDVECVQFLIDTGAQVDRATITEKGSTALHLASWNGHVECARLLIEKGAEIGKRTSDNGLTPLHVASWNGHVECVQALIEKGAEIDVGTTGKGSTPLHVASWNGHVECVQALIEKGAQVNRARSNDGLTPLLLAAENDHVETAQLLIDEGADVDKPRTDNGATPLSLAARYGNVDCARLLLLKNALVDKPRTDSGATPLHAASLYGHVDCVRLLIQNGAEIDKPTIDNRMTPLFVASWNGHVESVRILIDMGAKVDKENAENRSTALQLASQNGDVDCVRVLIEKGAEVDKPRADDGATPLHLASQNGHVACVRHLIEKGADIDKPRTAGATALHLASQNGHVDCVRLLVRMGADVEEKARSDDGATALHLAAEYGHEECIRLLIEKGADVDKTQNGAIFRHHAEGAEDNNNNNNNNDDKAAAAANAAAATTNTTNRSSKTTLVQLVVEMGAEVDVVRTDNGATPLHLAAQNGHVGCVRLLIANCAEVDKTTTDDGSTALHLASQNGHIDCMKFLIANGAEVNKRRYEVEVDVSSPPDETKDAERAELTEPRSSRKKSTTTSDGAIPLHLASQNGHVECVRLLVQNGAEINRPTTTDCSTALHLASQNSHVECVQLLVAKGADIRAKTRQKSTPRDLAQTVAVRQVLMEAAAMSQTGCCLIR